MQHTLAPLLRVSFHLLMLRFHFFGAQDVFCVSVHVRVARVDWKNLRLAPSAHVQIHRSVPTTAAAAALSSNRTKTPLRTFVRSNARSSSDKIKVFANSEKVKGGIGQRGTDNFAGKHGFVWADCKDWNRPPTFDVWNTMRELHPEKSSYAFPFAWATLNCTTCAAPLPRSSLSNLL